MSDVPLSQPPAETPLSVSPAAEASSQATAPEAAAPPVQPPKNPKPVGVEVGIRQVVVDGQLVPMPDRDQLKMPWMAE